MPRQDDKTLDLIRRAKANDERAFETLLRELEPELRKIAARYYINGADYQDVLQEGRIGVWKAVLDFDPEGGMVWKNFAVNLCCKRNVITAMAAANRKKYDLLNNAISLDTPIETSDENEQSLSDFIQDPARDLIDTYIIREEYEENARNLKKSLTSMEYAIFMAYAFDESYKEIAEELGVKSKAVDNALMRIRKKASLIYQEYLHQGREAELRDDLAGLGDSLKSVFKDILRLEIENPSEEED